MCRKRAQQHRQQNTRRQMKLSLMWRRRRKLKRQRLQVGTRAGCDFSVVSWCSLMFSSQLQMRRMKRKRLLLRRRKTRKWQLMRWADGRSDHLPRASAAWIIRRELQSWGVKKKNVDHERFRIVGRPLVADSSAALALVSPRLLRWWTSCSWSAQVWGPQSLRWTSQGGGECLRFSLSFSTHSEMKFWFEHWQNGCSVTHSILVFSRTAVEINNWRLSLSSPWMCVLLCGSDCLSDFSVSVLSRSRRTMFCGDLLGTGRSERTDIWTHSTDLLLHTSSCSSPRPPPLIWGDEAEMEPVWSSESSRKLIKASTTKTPVWTGLS